MKKLFKFIIYIALFYLIITNYEYISKYIMKNIMYHDKIEFEESNEFSKNESWNYAQITNNFEPRNKQDIINIIYTALDRGYDEITFYCDFNYTNCIEDTTSLLNNDENKISYLDNFLSAYNSFTSVSSNLNSLGRINLKIKKTYTKEQIIELRKKVDEIYMKIIKEDMNDREKIKAVHDYIINNTTYDDEAADKIKNNINLEDVGPSSNAYGALINGKAICSGYSDAMALFLDKMGIKNFKVISSSHMWNALYLDGKWLHLDLTWDDAPLSDGTSILIHNYFLLTTEELKNKDDPQHIYDTNVFDEIKN